MQELTITFTDNLDEEIVEKLKKDKKIKEGVLNKDTIKIKYDNLKIKKLYKKIEDATEDKLILKSFDKNLSNLKTYYINAEFNCEVCLSKAIFKLLNIEGISYSSYNNPTLTIKYDENQISLENLKEIEADIA